MGHIEKRSGGYRVRYHDPLGRRHSETFNRKMDAERFLREMEVEIDRGRWRDPRGAEMPLGTWAEEFSPSPAASPRRHRRPTAATWTSTSSPASPRTGSGDSRPTRSRTG